MILYQGDFLYICFAYLKRMYEFMKKRYIALFLLSSILIVFVLFFIKNRNKIHQSLFLAIDFPSYATEGSTLELQNPFEERVWLHRVNSIERLKAIEESFIGIELDVIYDLEAHMYYVAHDPEPQNYLYLDEFFSAINNIDRHYFWLDFKNLDETNSEESLTCLIQIINKYGIEPNRIIVESKLPEFLKGFSLFGFNTSYYLPSFNPYKASKEEILEHVIFVDEVLKHSYVNFISGNVVYYQFIKYYYPDSNMIVWLFDTGKTTRFRWRKIFNDDHVKVILKERMSVGYI